MRGGRCAVARNRSLLSRHCHHFVLCHCNRLSWWFWSLSWWFWCLWGGVEFNNWSRRSILGWTISISEGICKSARNYISNRNTRVCVIACVFMCFLLCLYMFMSDVCVVYVWICVFMCMYVSVFVYCIYVRDCLCFCLFYCLCICVLVFKCVYGWCVYACVFLQICVLAESYSVH